LINVLPLFYNSSIKKGKLMTKDEKLALLENIVRNQDENTHLVYARMYGMLSAWVRDEDLDFMLKYRGVDLDNLPENL